MSKYNYEELFTKMCKLVHTAYFTNADILVKQKQRIRTIDEEDIVESTIFSIPCYRITIEILELSNTEICIYLNDSWYIESDKTWYDEKIFACYTNGKEHVIHYDNAKLINSWYEFCLVIDFLEKEVTYV
jgi:hypothetical protein